MTQTITQPNVVARECRFAYHVPSNHPDRPDIHLVKEHLHLDTGEVVPNIRYVKDFKRPFWITKPQYRNHVEKKEWEHVDRLNKFECTQSKLRDTLASALDMRYSRSGVRDLCSSPYVYGADISSSSLIKAAYEQKYPDVKTGYTVATYDVETNVLDKVRTIIIATVTFKNQVFTAVLKSFVKGLAGVEERVEGKMRQYLQEYIDKRQLVCEIVVVDTEIDIVKAVFAKVHSWKPDFLAIWNKDYDIPKTIEACKRAGVDPKDIFSDPSVPEWLRFFKYRQGKKKKVTASGKVFPIPPASQWHVTHCLASFFVVDAMCVYKRLRIAAGEEPSYSLDAILNKELTVRKLKFKEADAYIGLRWHQFMQKEYPIEYIVYNRFDCISMLELDEKTKDLAFKMPSFSAFTDFESFHLSTRKMSDAFYFFCQKRGLVLASPGGMEKKDTPGHPDEEPIEDQNTHLSLDGWICTLPAHLMVWSGLQCIEEDTTIKTNARAFVSDSDAVSSYPSDISALNVSKETTRREIIDIIGIPGSLFRRQNINLASSSRVNAVEYCTEMFNFPSLPELLKLYEIEHHGNHPTLTNETHTDSRRVPTAPYQSPESVRSPSLYVRQTSLQHENV